MNALARTQSELAGAFGELRSTWRLEHTLVAVLLLAAAAAPFVAGDAFDVGATARWLYLATAATALWLAAGLAGMPSLAQGAFLGLGAFTFALLEARAGAPVLVALVGAVVVAAAAGAVAAAGVVRLRRLFIAVTTWILTWAFALFVAAFPGVSGGARGIVVTTGATARTHYLIALVLLAGMVAVAFLLARSPTGLQLRAARARPAAAAALGVPLARVRFGAFLASAIVAGLVGGLIVQLDGVADGSAYGPFLSFELLVAVIVGGAGSALGAPVGVAVLAAVGVLADAIARVENVPAERFHALFAATLVLIALSFGGDAVSAVASRLPPRRRTAVTPLRGALPAVKPREDLLSTSDVTKRFGALAALDGVSVAIRPAELCALVGPNGSGKTTLLRVLAGTVAPDAGRVLVAGRDATHLSQRERVLAGLVRTLQATSTFADLTVLEHVVVGAAAHGRYGGIRAATATPLAREEERELRRRALEVIAFAGLAGVVDARVDELPGAEQRLVAVTAALAASPRILLLDEPAAGGSPADVDRLVSLLHEVRALGIAVLLVDHDLRLVRRVADRVIVMNAGRVIADAGPAEVSRDEGVRSAFLGRGRL